MAGSPSDDGVGDFFGAEEGPGGAPVGNGAPMTGWQRLSQSFLRPPNPQSRRKPDPVDMSGLSDAERRKRINQIDSTERKIGLAAGILAAIFALVYTIPYMVSRISVPWTTVKPVDKICPSGLAYTLEAGKAATCNGVYPPSHYVFSLVLWLVFAAAILVTVRIGRRSPLAFAMVLTGLAFGTLILILPFLLAGGWLLLRAWRTQKYGAPTATSPVEGYVRLPPGAGRRRAATADTSAGAGASGGAGRNTTRRTRRNHSEQSPDVRNVPTQNKRYTPKAPARKKIPPST